MWWNWNSNGRQRGSLLWIIVPIIILIMLSNRDWNWGWSWWLIFIVPWFIVPRLWRNLRSTNDERGDSYAEEDDEKPKRDFEKPKRSFTSEDGSEFEVIEEEQTPRKRRDTPDDIEYV